MVEAGDGMKLTLAALVALAGAAFGQELGGPVDPATGELVIRLTAGRFVVAVTPTDPEQYADPLTITVDPELPPTEPIIIQVKWRNYSFRGTALSLEGVPASQVVIYDELGTKLGTCPVSQTTGAFSFISRANAYVLKPVWADPTVQADARTVIANHQTGDPKPIDFIGMPTMASVTLRLLGPDGQPGVGIVTIERVAE